MEQTATVLVVDDDDEMRSVNSLFLRSEGFNTREAADAMSAVEILAREYEKIDVIISDVLMPQMDGYAFCKKIKEHELYKDIPLVFISVLTTLDEKIKGYAVGAEDYISKPIEPAELSLKVRTLLEYRGRNKQLSEELKTSQSTAQQVMRYFSDMGHVIQYYNASIETNSFEELASALFDITTDLGLSCILQFQLPDSILEYSSSGKVTPLESNVIELARKEARFYDFGARTFINYDDFTLLIKNMPVGDSERYGILKDTLGTLCNATESKAKILLSDEIQNKKDMILNTVKSALEDINGAVVQTQQLNMSSVAKMMDAIDNSFIYLGLTEEQEESIREILVTCRNEIMQAFNKGLELRKQFEGVNNHLNGIFAIGK